MALTVRELIRELKRHPRNSLVGYQAHDNCEWEVPSLVSNVVEYDHTRFPDKERMHGDEKVKVVIR